MRLLTKTSIVALLALGAAAAWAQPPASGGPAAHMENLAILLDLTDAQKPQVQSILQGAHAQMRQLMEQSKANGGKPDFQAMRAAHQQIHQDTLQKLSTVLSPAQLKKFQALEQMHAHGFGHRGMGGASPAAPPAN
jgi:Spy/CpxP family protein refolding chaperone